MTEQQQRVNQGRPGVESEIADVAQGELAAQYDTAADDALLPRLVPVRARLLERFGELEPFEYRCELTLVVPDPARIVEILRFCRDDPSLRCDLLADLSCVHWPGGQRVEHVQETTGWPSYETEASDGRIEVDYVLYSIRHNHRFRLRVNLPDDLGARMPSAAEVYGSAIFMEREAYDMFGVVFEGHPNLTRVLMPEDWEGHPQRRDYPLGGVEVQYKGATIPPPDERHY